MTNDDMPLPDAREVFAVNVRDAISDHYPWNGVDVALGANTSGCPTIRVDLGNGEVYNITITRARP